MADKLYNGDFGQAETYYDYTPEPKEEFGPPADFGTIAAYQPNVLNEPTFGKYGVTGYKGPEINMDSTRKSSQSSLGNYTPTPYGAGAGIKTGTGLRPSSRTSGYSTGSRTLSPLGTITTARVVAPTGPVPTLGAPAPFEVPVWDTRAIAAAAQTKTAAQRRTLRRQAQRAVGRYEENPVVRGMNLERVLQGYGTGLAAARASAEASATREYTERYSREFTAAQTEYAAQEKARVLNFDAAWQKYLKGYTTTQTTRNVYKSSQFAQALGGPTPPSMGNANASLGIA